MEKEFVPYELALRMKALGFDGPCMGFFNGKHHDWLIDDNGGLTNVTINPNKNIGDCIKRPTWQSAFRWFREKYELHHVIHQFNFKKDTDEEYLAEVGQTDDGFMYFRTYEECECFCLTKLIEIVENEKTL
jgi:hypothetical protein